jgi:hypothetical protein
MLDQSFSSSNFVRTFHIENRKGTFNKNLLSTEYLAVHEKIKLMLLAKENFEKTEFEKLMQELNEKKEEALLIHLENVSAEINSNAFQFKLKSFEIEDKDIYTTNADAASFFAMKQLQHNIAKTFKVRQGNRYQIVKQLNVLLQDGFPKYVLRTDIKSFYESIPQHYLLNKIEENQLLNYQSKKLVKGLIRNYNQNGGSGELNIGVPRGVGVSAYLSELYMRDIDNAIKLIPDVVYYARYVDDMIIVFIPKSEEKMGPYLAEVKKIIDNAGLKLKDGLDGGKDKTLELNLFKKDIATSFDFLGYKFVIENSKLTRLRLSDNKIAKYDQRLRKSIQDYNESSKYGEKKAKKLLLKRLKFLTGNFHLINNKRLIKSGIYYSNILLTSNNSENLMDLTHLDNLLKGHVSKLKPFEKLNIDISKLKKTILERYSFKQGFFKRSENFHTFSALDFQQITSAWKI